MWSPLKDLMELPAVELTPQPLENIFQVISYAGCYNVRHLAYDNKSYQGTKQVSPAFVRSTVR